MVYLGESEFIEVSYDTLNFFDLLFHCMVLQYNNIRIFTSFIFATSFGITAIFRQNISN